jgi:hypothetical protein
LSRRARPAKPQPGIDWLAALQFAASGLFLTLFWSAALGSLVLAASSFGSATPETANFLLVSLGALWAGTLLLPSAAYSLAKLLGRPLPARQIPPGLRRWLPLLLFTTLALAIFIGDVMLKSGLDLFLSPLHILAASLTVAWLAALALGGIEPGSAQLRWGGLASGLSAAPLISITLEAAAGLLVLLIGLVYVTTNPALSSELMRIQSSWPTLQNEPERLLGMLHDFATDPIILSLILTNFSLFVPLIEELAKPVAVWLLVWRRQLTNAQGFGIGLLGGAGFGLLENLFSGAQTAEWTGTAVIRIGATAFHMATAGLMGWAIARAKNEGRYLAVFVVYGFNLLLHGLWNGVVVTQTFALASSDPMDLATASGLILLAITLLSITILITMNRRLQPKPALAPRLRPAAKTKRSSTKK